MLRRGGGPPGSCQPPEVSPTTGGLANNRRAWRTGYAQGCEAGGNRSGACGRCRRGSRPRGFCAGPGGMGGAGGREGEEEPAARRQGYARDGREGRKDQLRVLRSEERRGG